MASRKPRRRMSQVAFVSSMMVAIIADLAGYIGIPFIGGLIILLLKGIYIIEGFSGGLFKKFGVKGVIYIMLNYGSLISEWIPLLGNAIPGSILFVLVAFGMNRSGYKARMIEEELERKLQIRAQVEQAKRFFSYYGSGSNV